jgi:hypothetical protein
MSLYPKISNILNQVEASIPLYQKKMRECTICKSAGFSEQLITFLNMGEDSVTGKTIWKPMDENGNEHKHKFNIQGTKKPTYLKKNCRYCCCHQYLGSKEIVSTRMGI